MKVILNESQVNKLILEFLGSSWLSGAYLIESEVIGNWKVDIEVRLHMIKFKSLDDDMVAKFEDYLADNIINSITKLWNKFDISVEDAIMIWIRRYKDFLEKNEVKLPTS